jgi:DTW domain-containing protein YfiP
MLLREVSVDALWRATAQLARKRPYLNQEHLPQLAYTGFQLSAPKLA